MSLNCDSPVNLSWPLASLELNYNVSLHQREVLKHTDENSDCTAKVFVFSPNENKAINLGARRNGSVLHNLLQYLCKALENMRVWRVFHLPKACKNYFSAPAHSQFICTKARLPFLLPWHCRTTNTPRLSFSKQYKGVKHSDPTEFQWMLDMQVFSSSGVDSLPFRYQATLDEVKGLFWVTSHLTTKLENNSCIYLSTLSE